MLFRFRSLIQLGLPLYTFNEKDAEAVLQYSHHPTSQCGKMSQIVTYTYMRNSSKCQSKQGGCRRSSAVV